MIRIAICDDNRIELEQTFEIVEKYRQTNMRHNVEISKFSDGQSLLNSMENNGNFHIYILDIVMPEMTGIELGEKINRIDEKARIILLTTSREFGVESYTISAKNYLLKPCEEQKMFQALNKLLQDELQDVEKHFTVHVPTGTQVIPYNELQYIEYYKHRLIAYTRQEKVESATLRESFYSLVSGILEDERFVQVSASHIINMQYVKRFTSRYIEMMGGEQITLSRIYANARNIYMEYMFERNNR